MLNNVLDKTEKGRDEIATRSHHLASRLRTLLLLVDGKTSSDHLLKTVSGLGMTSQDLQKLIDQGFIIARTMDHTVIAEAGGGEPVVEGSTSTLTATPALETGIKPVSSHRTDVVAQIQAAHQFYNETIKAYIGLRGIGLQLKVERAATLDDYRALRKPFLDAIRAHKGDEIARSLDAKLHIVLYSGESSALHG